MMPLLGFITISTLLFIHMYVARSAPPEDPIKCSCSKNTSCTITNSYGMFPDRTICKASQVLYPTTEQELITMVASATKHKTKMKVATRFSHSIPKWVCPDGQNGLLISTKYLNQILKIDAKERRITVQSGVTLKQVVDEAAKAGLALPYGPYWWGLAIGGLIGTGAHGSSLCGRGSAVHDHVLELRIVTSAGPEDGYAKVHTLNEEQHEHLNAAKVSLGVLGVISQITLKLEPLFKRSITYLLKSDWDLGDEAVAFGQKHEFADITWYPNQRKAAYRVDDRVPINASGDGTYDFIPFRSAPLLELATLRTTEDVQEFISDSDGKCLLAKTATNSLLARAYGLTNNGKVFTRFPVIGFQNNIQASGSCLEEDAKTTSSCPWDMRVKGEFFHQTTFSIGLSAVKSFIEDVQSLVELEPKGFCGSEIYNGILMRYVKASSAYLGKQEDAIDFDITYYRSKDPMTPRLYEDIFEEVEQLGIFKYEGLPHWGKNRNLAFGGVIKKYKNAGEFFRVKDEYDPQGLFSSEWTAQVLGQKGGVTISKDGCALEGLCICSHDNHCAPTKGYFCRPGKVYKEARVCTRLRSEQIMQAGAT